MCRFLVCLQALLLLVSSELVVHHRLYTREDASGEGQLVPEADNCNDYDVRLVEGNGYMGRVEACYSRGGNSSLWGPICKWDSTTWGVGHAVTVCRQLNFSTAATAVSIIYDNVEGPYSYSFYCDRGNPPYSIQKCDREILPNNCKVAGGVICYVPEEERCLTGDVRLVNGSSVAGRVEVCFNGVWGTVCRTTNWNAPHATVVCRQLGHNATAHVPIGVRTLRYGEGNATQPILLHNVECSGHEANLSECIHSEVNDIGQCTHAEDVGVICEAPAGGCSDTDIRLQGGTDNSSGTVQVCFTGLWGAVCDIEWDEVDALVACRQLGYSELEFIHSESDIDPLVQNLLSGLNCNGSEERLADCDHDGVNIATTGCLRAAVRCKNKVLPPTSPSPSPSSSPSPSPSSPSSSTKDSNAVIIGSILGGLVLALIITISIIIAVFVCRGRAVRKKADYNLNNSRHLPAAVPEYVDMQSAANYLVPVVSRNSVDIYSEWRDILKTLLLEQSQLTLTDSLGEGCFGRVYKGRMTSRDGEVLEVAVKTLKDISTPENINDFVKESILMLGFDHPNVLKLLGVCFDTDDNLPLIVLPYMANGDLRSFLMSKRDPSVGVSYAVFPQGLDEETAIKMCLDIAQGMEYLSSSSFVHRDLAARNCMVSEDMTVTIADFGLSRDVYSKDYYRMGTKTLLPVKWMAPESLNDNVYTVQSDVWSFGVVCWEIFSLGSTPYPGVGNHEVSDYIADGHRLKQPKLCPPEMFMIIERCWNIDSNMRPAFPELVEMVNSALKLCMEEQPFYVNVESNGTPQSGLALHTL